MSIFLAVAWEVFKYDIASWEMAVALTTHWTFVLSYIAISSCWGLANFVANVNGWRFLTGDGIWWAIFICLHLMLLKYCCKEVICPRKKSCNSYVFSSPRFIQLAFVFFSSRATALILASRIDICDLWDLVLACGSLLGSVNEMD